MPCNFSFKYLSTFLTFQSATPAVIDYISFIYGKLQADPSSTGEKVYTIQKETRGYSLIHDGKKMFNNFPLDTAIENMEISVEIMVMSENPRILFIHAGAVSDREGNTSLILAESGGGKTTLCSVLAQRGFYLEGDELLGIPPESPLTPIPFKKASKLRRESLPFLKDKGKLLAITNGGSKEGKLIYWLPDEKRKILPENKKRIRRIFFLRFSPYGSNSISCLSPPEAINGLIDACHDFYKKKLLALDIVFSMLHQVEMFEIIYNQPGYALSCIEDASFFKVRA